MPANLLDIDDPNLNIPEFIVLDASIVLELRTTRIAQPRQKSAASFLNRLRNLTLSGHVMPLLPLLAFEECYFKICQSIIKTEKQRANSPGDWHVYYKNNPNVILRCQDDLNTFNQILQAFPIVVTEPEDLAVLPLDTEQRLAERMGELIQNYRILPKDATILSTAERLGIDTVVSLDGDWARATGFNVITKI
jgi:hypothetical protein